MGVEGIVSKRVNAPYRSGLSPRALASSKGALLAFATEDGDAGMVEL